MSISLLLLSGCDRLASIPYMPEQTPENWLRTQPFVDLKIGRVNFVLVQPSSTIFVYLLGIITIGVGLYFFKIQDNHHARKWWGVALLLWGSGALFAGTSYQALSYEIKCAGQALCSWTSWWEIIYLILSAASIDAMVISGAYSGCRRTQRKVLTYYAILNSVLYTVLVIFGAFSLNKFLISFELLLIVTAPNILILFILNGWRYFKSRGSMDFVLLVTWLWLGVTIGAYFIYLLLDITDGLWERGIWFSENDVLHIGLISWMVYIAINVAKRIVDEQASELV
ncbi:MAG: hypothetical protein GY943_20040 [Chloroflexi bacterium]|nr:hypothetical protein [Chloroflexota bacterium]